MKKKRYFSRLPSAPSFSQLSSAAVCASLISSEVVDSNLSTRTCTCDGWKKCSLFDVLNSVVCRLVDMLAEPQWMGSRRRSTVNNIDNTQTENGWRVKIDWSWKFTWISISTQNKCQFEPLFSRCCVDFLCSFFCVLLSSREHKWKSRDIHSTSNSISDESVRQEEEIDNDEQTGALYWVKYLAIAMTTIVKLENNSWPKKLLFFPREWKKQIIVLVEWDDGV